MRPALLLATLMMIASASAWAYTDNRVRYYCTDGNPFTDGVSKKYAAFIYDRDNVEGVFNGKEFSFVDHSPKHNRKDGTLTWEYKGDSVEMQIPGPYDGLQDTMWGKITIGSHSKEVSCYISD